ncbi:MAG: DMT family transporter [Clostridia bacterium]|nr:DMT family transporter [Clostridia bacterium]
MAKNSSQLKGALILLSTSVIWGSAFVAQSAGIEKVDAFTFSGIRTVIGALFLFIFIVIRDAVTAKKLTPGEKILRKKGNKKALIYGSVLGVVLCAATNFQQFAFYDSTPGKIALITALYMFFVPIIGLFFKKKVPVVMWFCVAAGFVGLYFLCIDPSESFRINRGDLLALICAILFSVQILLVERYAPLADGIKISCVEFAVSGVLSCILMFIFEKPVVSNIVSAWLPILYAGILSTGVAYTLQIVGQRMCEATVASLMMCAESVFAVLTAAIVLGQVPSAREGIGCLIMFAAIVVSQVAEPVAAKIKRRRQLKKEDQ